MKIMVVCGHGLGSSLIIGMSIKGILDQLHIDAEVDHEDLSSAKSTQADIFVGTRDIADQLRAAHVAGYIVSLKNMVDKEDMKARLSVALQDMGAM